VIPFDVAMFTIKERQDKDKTLEVEEERQRLLFFFSVFSCKFDIPSVVIDIATITKVSSL
jgi:hypothetical protein